MSATYDRLKAFGMCPGCGKRRPAPGRVHCETCLKLASRFNAIYEKARRKEWEAAGKCTHCGGEREDERFRWCRACRAWRNAYEKMRRPGTGRSPGRPPKKTGER